VHKIVDERLKERVGAEAAAALHFFDGSSHAHLMNLPKTIRKILNDETRLFTVEQPIFMY
jgi:hypothetical protein